jgi:cofilin
MATGVQIDSQLISEFNEFKMSSKHRFMLFKVSDDKKSIILDTKGDINRTYADFVSALPQNDCRYGVVNFEYNQGADGKRSKIVFVNWAPETAPIKSKMVYAGTKNDLKKSLVGLSIEIQGTDLSEVDEGEVLTKLQQISK